MGLGDVIGHPKGAAAHHIEVTGAETFRALSIGERLPHDMCNLQLKGKRIFRNAGLLKIMADMGDVTYPQAGKK